MSAIHQLAHLFLRDEAAQRWPQLDIEARDQALTACGIGCDHVEGEELVAIIDETVRDHVFVGAVITSRRYAWRNMSGCGEIAWADLARVSVERDALVTAHRFTRHDGQTLRIPPTRALTTDLFRAIVRLRGEERAVSVRPLPAGRTNARHILLERCAAFGRGQHRGQWLSPLAPNELARAIAIVLGPPVESAAVGEHFVCDFNLPAAWLGLGQIAAPPAHLRTLAAAGYTQTVARVRITTKPVWPGCTFTLVGMNNGVSAERLERMNPVLAAALLTRLGRVEPRLVAPPVARQSAPAALTS